MPAPGISSPCRLLPLLTHPVLFIAIPAHNEVETIGVLLWRLRSVLAEFPRDYEVVVYDDASTDNTQELLESYTRVLPLTILRGERQVGYARALDLLLRHVVRQTRHPRRDAVLLLQADFTDPPGLIPEFARRFEGGADIVAGERTALADAPVSVQRLFRFSGWSMRPFVRVDGIQDVTSSLRLVRIATVRDLMQERGDNPLCEGDSWTANADLLLRLVPFARRIETVPVQSTYGVRLRETRRITTRDAVAALKWAWSARKRRVRALAGEPDTARSRDDARMSVSRSDGDDRPPRKSRGERQRNGATASPSGKPRRAKHVDNTPAVARPVAVVSAPQSSDARDGNDDAATELRKRKRRKRGARRPLAPDTTEETLSIVDPAAGIASDMDIGGDDETAATSGDALDLEKRRRRKRRRRKRAREGNGDVHEDGDSLAASAFEGSDNADRVRDDTHGHRDDDSGNRDDAENAGEENEAAEGDGAANARKRGRRGRRGGRRTRRNREPGDVTDSNGDSNAQDADSSPYRNDESASDD